MANKFIGQRKWVHQVLQKFTDLEAGLPEIFAKDPEWPDWVYNLLIQLMGTSHPGSKIKQMNNWKAKDLGRFLGRQYAGEFLLQGKVPVTEPVVLDLEKFGKWTKIWNHQRNPDFDEAEFNRQADEREKIWRPRFQQFMQETVASACTRPYIETRDFFEAFGKAMVMKPNEFEMERTLGVGDRICWTMLVMWPDIQRLKSISQLHQAFEKALKPKGIKVKYKRIEKLCQRIGLKFREGGGRPKGSKNSDKSLRSLGVISQG